jgi:hypothetical protein
MRCSIFEAAWNLIAMTLGKHWNDQFMRTLENIEIIDGSILDFVMTEGKRNENV